MNKTIIAVIMVAVILVGGYFTYKGMYKPTPPTQQPASSIKRPILFPVPNQSAGQATQSITIANFSFQPANATLSVGKIVTWTNNDSVSHTVTADDGSFDSGAILPGNTFSHTFTIAGSAAYHCSIHSSMHGSITVGK